MLEAEFTSLVIIEGTDWLNGSVPEFPVAEVVAGGGEEVSGGDRGGVGHGLSWGVSVFDGE